MAECSRKRGRERNVTLCALISVADLVTLSPDMTELANVHSPCLCVFLILLLPFLAILLKPPGHVCERRREPLLYGWLKFCANFCMQYVCPKRRGGKIKRGLAKEGNLYFKIGTTVTISFTFICEITDLRTYFLLFCSCAGCARGKHGRAENNILAKHREQRDVMYGSFYFTLLFSVRTYTRSCRMCK